MSATNVSQFAHHGNTTFVRVCAPKKHHEQQCVRNNVSSFASTFRAGLAITLALSGSQLPDIMDHVGWRQAPTASHYLKVAHVLRPGGPSDLLSRHDPSAQALAVSYADLNSLRRFTVAFPTGSSP